MYKALVNAIRTFLLPTFRDLACSEALEVHEALEVREAFQVRRRSLHVRRPALNVRRS